jgi:fumarylacetoacetase
MLPGLNETHDPTLKSWVDSACVPEAPFPIQNLPMGVFRRHGMDSPRIGVAIGDRILDLAWCEGQGLLREHCPEAGLACLETTLNRLMALGQKHLSSLRRRVSGLLRADSPEYLRNPSRLSALTFAAAEAAMLVPASIGDYTDFYASIYHATNVGRLFRPDDPLFPNYKYIPIAYHGRASSIVASGTPVRRPCGQVRNDPSRPPVFETTGSLDYELEVGFFVGLGNELGSPIPVQEAGEHIFGLCLVNDWSARDIQRWEYQPLGPFLAKSFATTISPWVVTLEALAPFRSAALRRPEGDPCAMGHLSWEADAERGAIDLELEVWIWTAAMRGQGLAPMKLSRSNLRDLYWTPAQMIAHHSSNGCNLRPGDLIASGTVSGAERESWGCLLELTAGGKTPIRLPGGEERRFLGNGDEVIITGFCRRDGFVPIGFGECRGSIG